MTDTDLYCSNCGQQLASNAKFCSSCGAPVESGAPRAGTSRPTSSERDWGGYSQTTDSSPRDENPTPDPPSDSGNEPYAGGFANRKPTWEAEREQARAGVDDEWSMPNLGPPKPQRRRTWLWVLLGMIALVVIACCVGMFWILGTESGTQWFEGLATQAAEEIQRATETAATPQP